MSKKEISPIRISYKQARAAFTIERTRDGWDLSGPCAWDGIHFGGSMYASRHAARIAAHVCALRYVAYRATGIPQGSICEPVDKREVVYSR